MNLDSEDIGWFVLTGAVLLLLLMSPFLHRALKRRDGAGSDAAGADYLALTGGSLESMVERGLLSPEEAEVVRRKSRERMKAELEQKLRAEAQSKFPPGAVPRLDPVQMAVAEARRAKPAPGSVPDESPAEEPKRPRLPERLRPLAGKPGHELEELRQAEFLSDDDIAMLKERAK